MRNGVVLSGEEVNLVHHYAEFGDFSLADYFRGAFFPFLGCQLELEIRRIGVELIQEIPREKLGFDSFVDGFKVGFSVRKSDEQVSLDAVIEAGVWTQDFVEDVIGEELLSDFLRSFSSDQIGENFLSDFLRGEEEHKLVKEVLEIAFGGKVKGVVDGVISVGEGLDDFPEGGSEGLSQLNQLGRHELSLFSVSDIPIGFESLGDAGGEIVREWSAVEVIDKLRNVEAVLFLEFFLESRVLKLIHAVF
jgi:hypothetical protein